MRDHSQLISDILILESDISFAFCGLHLFPDSAKKHQRKQYAFHLLQFLSCLHVPASLAHYNCNAQIKLCRSVNFLGLPLTVVKK
jgi:hypothetical protein